MGIILHYLQPTESVCFTYKLQTNSGQTCTQPVAAQEVIASGSHTQK